MTEFTFSYTVWIEYKAKPADGSKNRKSAGWYSIDFTVPLQEDQQVEIAGYRGRVRDLMPRPTTYDPKAKNDSWDDNCERNSCTVNLGKITRETYEEVQEKIQRLERWRY